MSLNPDIRDQAYQFFIEEAQELLQILENGLLHLKNDHSTSKVHELMRAAHSIKGGAASVELDTIKHIAHRLEDFFKALYSEKIEFDNQLETLLLRAYDGLREPLTEQMEMGSFDRESAIANVEPIFSELEIILGDALEEADNYIPSATDLGVDIVASIFEIDVQQSLDHLLTVKSNPEQFDVERELKEQLEVLGGFAELFTLPGFTEIIDLSNNAIAKTPQQALAIMEVVIRDCQQAREAILNGDRKRGGEPSATLIAISQGTTDELVGDNIILSDNSDSTGILEALNSGSTAPEEIVNVNPADSLENLFGGDLEGENLFAISDLDPVTDDENTNDKHISVEELFGESLSEIDSNAVKQKQEPEETLDIFDFVPEDDLDSGKPFDWGDIPSEKSILETPSSPQEETNDFADIEDVFGVPAPEDNSFDILELGAKILDGETVPNLPESEFQPNEDIVNDVHYIDGIVSATIENSPQLDSNNRENPELLEVITQNSSENPEQQSKPEINLLESDRSTATDTDRVAIDNQNENEVEEKPSDLNFTPPENLDNALESVNDIFEQLPPAKKKDFLKDNTQTSQTVAPTKGQKSKQDRSVKQAPLGNQLTVRVDLERLERMNNLIGELVINRNSLALQNEQLQLGVKDITKKFTRFRTVTTKLRELSDRMLVESEHSQQQALFSNDTSDRETSELETENNFDSLEMDSYNHLHLLLQGILEEIMQLEEGVDDIFLFAQQSDRTIHAQRQMLGQMRDELMWARMLPLEQILKRFPRTLRDLSNQYQKPVELNLFGTGVLVDKAVLEKLYDPLLHLLRNGFDHGIELPEIRRQQGKPETGKIEIHAYYQGNQTIIEIRDDGKGLDLHKIARKGLKKGLISEAELENVTQERIFDLIFEPGFSTAEKVSEISGRGVGMSVVREQIESLKGTISVSSTPNKGSIFTLSLPLTLTIAKLLVISLSETAFALPSDSIEEIIIPTSEQIKFSGKQKFLFWKDRLISVYNLQQILEYNCVIIPIDTNSKVFESVAAPKDWALPLLLLRRGKQLFALEVSCLITEQELVIKPFGKTLTAPNYTYGCTILGDGTLIPVLNGTALISEFLGETANYKSSDRQQNLKLDLQSELSSDLENINATVEAKPLIRKTDKTTTKIQQNTIMIVDDSTALRRTMALSLERQGYRIFQAKDGRDAVEQLRKNSGVDLIVCDVEMPHMNGFEFLGVRRRDSELKSIPVIMLTSRSGAKHRNLAKQLGANGYFTKPYVEQEFLKELDKILSDRLQSIPAIPEPKSDRQERQIEKLSLGRHKTYTPTINQKVTVLIIDDSSALRRTMSLSLQKKGYRILEARDGEEGIEQMYKNDNISLVICDIEMPKMNGFEVLSSRRQDPQLQKIPVAMLTSRNQDKHKNLAVQLGANAYFIKPYVEQTFMTEIEKLIS